jgi:hypothetical protein
MISTPNFDVRQLDFIPRNAGKGSDFFTVSLRASRSFPLSGGSRIEGLIEAFNLTDRVNPITRNTTFGPGSYASNPVPSFNTVTAVGDPRSIQFGVRLTF